MKSDDSSKYCLPYCKQHFSPPWNFLSLFPFFCWEDFYYFAANGHSRSHSILSTFFSGSSFVFVSLLFSVFFFSFTTLVFMWLNWYSACAVYCFSSATAIFHSLFSQSTNNLLNVERFRNVTMKITSFSLAFCTEKSEHNKHTNTGYCCQTKRKSFIFSFERN